MKLEIPTQLKTLATQWLSNTTVREALVIAGFGIALIGVLFLYSWCSASDVANVPPAVIEHEKNAVILNDQATADETAANETQKREVDNQAKIDALNKQIDAAKRDTQISRTKLNDLENEYEKLRKSAVPVGNDDLDARESRLLTKLRAQQAGQ